MEHVINTPSGAIKGIIGERGIVSYKGIRYATAGRWKYPVTVEHWDGTYDATSYADCCCQPRTFLNEAEMPEKTFYFREFRNGKNYSYSEDCLNLNIWAPGHAENLPVLLYIHGGGFIGGSSDELPFLDPVWPEYDVIAVTINYRLGPLGFLVLPELEKEAGSTGNYGLADQLAALEWVRRNISAFGGDPERVTVMGQSAGAMSIQQHVFSPISGGLFARAVMSSGAGVHEILSAGKPEMHYPFWQKVMAEAGCMTLDAFRALPVEKLFSSWQKVRKEFPMGNQMTAPVIDGRYITDTGMDLLKAGKAWNIDYMLGTTSEDMMSPVLYMMAQEFSKAMAAQGNRSYLWYFDRQLPGDERGAWHSSDLWYWFGTLDNSWRPMTEKDHELSETMISYLMNFVRTGDPNGEGLPEWHRQIPESENAMHIGEEEPHMAPVDVKALFAKMPKGTGM